MKITGTGGVYDWLEQDTSRDSDASEGTRNWNRCLPATDPPPPITGM